MSYTSSQYWDNYYKNTAYEKIPWKGNYSRFLSKLLKQVPIPPKGNVLDVGCGIGEKSLYFAELGYAVWGFDISHAAIAQAKKAALSKKHQPVFFQADILNLDAAKELVGIQFDLILDSLVSHFLSSEEKEFYLQQLTEHIHTQKTILFLQVIGKEKDTDLSQQPQWIQDIAQTPEQVQNSYGTFFRCLKKHTQVDLRGVQVDTYIMQAL